VFCLPIPAKIVNTKIVTPSAIAESALVNDDPVPCLWRRQAGMGVGIARNKLRARFGGGEDMARVLIAEDDGAVREFVRRALVHGGHEVATANDGLDALDVLGVDENFDLLITDQTMPHLTGIQLAREIHVVRPELPVLLITGFSGTVNAENFAEQGLSGYMRKPLVPRELAATVRRLLDRKRSSAPPV